jgi:nucleoid DNA-binding protein
VGARVTAAARLQAGSRRNPLAVADRAEMNRADARRALAALDAIVLEELGNAQKDPTGGLVQLTVRVKPAQKKRRGPNPATGEEIDVPAKPASVDVRARPLAKAKAALPSVQGAAAARGDKRTRPALAPPGRGTKLRPARPVALL